MTQKNRMLAMALAGALSVGCLAGCGSSSGSSQTASSGSAGAAKSDSKGTITVITKALNSDHWHMVQAGALLMGEELGYDINVLGPNDESNTQEEMNMILDAAANGTDGLVIAPNDPESLASTIADVHSQGIPTIIIDSELPEGKEDAADAFAGTDNYAAGKAMGEYIGKNHPGETVGIITGPSGSVTHEDRCQGYKDGMAQYDCNVLEPQPADADTAKAVTVAENMIQAYPDLDVIVTTCDTMGTGAYRAVSTSGKEDEITVYSFDGANEGLESILKGEIKADCAQMAIDVGGKGVELCATLIEGGELEQYFNDTGYLIITEENAQEYLDDVNERMAKAGISND